MENKFVDIILNFMQEAGDMALYHQDKLVSEIKADMSIVTNVDLKISRLFYEKIKRYLDMDGHKLLDEEHLPDINEFFNEKNKFLWIIDPIDGTTTYYYGFPLWAIAVSLYKDMKPYISAIYVPSTRELIYTDSVHSYIVKNAFLKSEVKEILKTKEMDIERKSIILQHKLLNYDNYFSILDLYSCYVLSFYTLANRSICSFLNKPAKLWDIAATLPIAYNLDFCFRSIDNDLDLDHISSDIIDESWTLKDTFMLCNRNKYLELKEKMSNLLKNI